MTPVILIVEDNPDTAELMELAVQRTGHEVAGVAATPQEVARIIAESQAQGRPVEGIITDDQIPHGSSRDIVQLAEGAGIPVLVQTAQDAETIRKLAEGYAAEGIEVRPKGGLTESMDNVRTLAGKIGPESE